MRAEKAEARVAELTEALARCGRAGCPSATASVGTSQDDPLTPTEEAIVKTQGARFVGEACDRPPASWSCSRNPGHDGPCAATKIAAGPRPSDASVACETCGGTGRLAHEAWGTGSETCPDCKSTGKRPNEASHAPWMTVINREQQVEALPWADEASARNYFDPAQQQWSDSWLCRVVIGPCDVHGMKHEQRLDKANPNIEAAATIIRMFDQRIDALNEAVRKSDGHDVFSQHVAVVLGELADEIGKRWPDADPIPKPHSDYATAIEDAAREAERAVVEYSAIDVVDKTPEKSRIARRIRALASGQRFDSATPKFVTVAEPSDADRLRLFEKAVRDIDREAAIQGGLDDAGHALEKVARIARHVLDEIEPDSAVVVAAKLCDCECRDCMAGRHTCGAVACPASRSETQAPTVSKWPHQMHVQVPRTEACPECDTPLDGLAATLGCKTCDRRGEQRPLPAESSKQQRPSKAR